MDITYLVHPLKATLFALLWVASASLHAQSVFPIDVTSELNDLELAVASSSIGNQVMVSVKNEGEVAARCQAVFHNGPQTPVERRADIAAGKTATMTAPLKRSVTRVEVTLNCGKQTD